MGSERYQFSVSLSSELNYYGFTFLPLSTLRCLPPLNSVTPPPPSPLSLPLLSLSPLRGGRNSISLSCGKNSQNEILSADTGSQNRNRRSSVEAGRVFLSLLSTCKLSCKPPQFLFSLRLAARKIEKTKSCGAGKVNWKVE